MGWPQQAHRRSLDHTPENPQLDFAKKATGKLSGKSREKKSKKVVKRKVGSEKWGNFFKAENRRPWIYHYRDRSTCCCCCCSCHGDNDDDVLTTFISYRSLMSKCHQFVCPSVASASRSGVSAWHSARYILQVVVVSVSYRPTICNAISHRVSSHCRRTACTGCQ